MNCTLHFHDIFLSFSKPILVTRILKMSFNVGFNFFNRKTGVCLFSTCWYGPLWIQVGRKRYVCMYVYVAKYSVFIDTQLTFLQSASLIS